MKLPDREGPARLRRSCVRWAARLTFASLAATGVPAAGAGSEIAPDDFRNWPSRALRAECVRQVIRLAVAESPVPPITSTTRSGERDDIKVVRVHRAEAISGRAFTCTVFGSRVDYVRVGPTQEVDRSRLVDAPRVWVFVMLHSQGMGLYPYSWAEL
jgi:hypothetical protein